MVGTPKHLHFFTFTKEPFVPIVEHPVINKLFEDLKKHEPKIWQINLMVRSGAEEEPKWTVVAKINTTDVINPVHVHHLGARMEIRARNASILLQEDQIVETTYVPAEEGRMVESGIYCIGLLLP